jgi:pyrroline-5-carboxylate reductase
MRLGIIGAGNMGTAIIRGYTASGADAADITVLGHHPEKLKAMESELGIRLAADYEELASLSDAVMIAVKPKDMAEVLAEISPFLNEKQIIVSIAAGKTIKNISDMMNNSGIPAENRKIVRVMPNTPAMVGEAMSAVCRNQAVSDEEFASVTEIFAGVGRAAEITENLMDAAGAVSGCSPAYVYMFIEALADGGVQAGMPRAQAYEFAAQSVMGAAKMVLETGEHPGVLKDAVCSPGGTTIEAVSVLERGGFRSTVIDAVAAAAEKSKKM